ncbi:MAG: peptidoglycan DD-metalloendopeptidase family protein [Bacteroidales bacterium]|nr:peptidoglycan DD-metalloendopeptidase family protein [Bacteroidales bacterium]
MAKKAKYILDFRTLLLKKERTSKKEIVKKVLSFVFAVIVLFASAVAFTIFIFDSPEERRLRRDLEQAKFQYSQLDRRIEFLSQVLMDIQARDENLYRIIFEAEPPRRNPHLLGGETYEQFRGNSMADVIINTSIRIDDLMTRMYSQSVSFDDVYEMARNREAMLASMPAILPVNLRNTRLISGFGPRIDPILRVRRMHTGVDFAGPLNTPIYATGSGVVTHSGPSGVGFSGYGIMVMIDHGFGFQTLYGHLNRTNVRVGQRVNRGDVIGFMGTTGRSTGVHLHYEVFRHGERVNPVFFFFQNITPEEYLEILERASEINQMMS